MVLLLEREGESRKTLDKSTIEPFTQRKFDELVSDAYLRKLQFMVCGVRCAGREGDEVFYYDARNLCKYVFELVICRDGRKVRIKNFKDPVTERDIREIAFFEVHPRSEGPLVAEFVGTQKTFMESHAFRSRIFNRRDPFDSLSINFVFKEQSPMLKQRSLVPLFISLVATTIILFMATLVFFHKRSLGKTLLALKLRHEFEKLKKFTK
jgi:Domain of unknown function (DUF5092)